MQHKGLWLKYRSLLPFVLAFSAPGAITNRENFNKKIRYIRDVWQLFTAGQRSISLFRGKPIIDCPGQSESKNMEQTKINPEG